MTQRPDQGPNRLSGMLLGAMMALGVSVAAHAQSAPAQYVVIYGELKPAALGQGAFVLAGLEQLARRTPGLVSFEVNWEIGRPNLFTLTEIWQSPAAYAAFTAAGDTQIVLGYLTPLMIAPFDERDGVLIE